MLSVKADLAKIQLTQPACTEIGEKVALSRRIDKHWRLVGESFHSSPDRSNFTENHLGWGNIQRGVEMVPDDST